MNEQIQNCMYYHLINQSSGLALSVPKQIDYKKCSMVMEEIDCENVNQLWMINNVVKNGYDILHCVSNLTIEDHGGVLQLHHEKSKENQWFSFKSCKLINDPELFWIQEFHRSTKLMYFDKSLVCGSRDPGDPKTIWRLRRAVKNCKINQSCLIQFEFSGQMMQVRNSTTKEGIYIVQNTLSGRFSQRWFILYYENFFLIKNMKSQLYLQVKGGKAKEGANIIQSKFNGQPFQLWRVQQRGPRIYIIRSAMDTDFAIGFKQRTLKQDSELTLTENDTKQFWRIVGFVPN